jgi:molybdopterin molybdotransferase
MSERRLIDDCFLTDKERLTHDEALAILRDRVGPVVDSETVPLTSALNRFLAESVTAPRDVPSTDNAAVDGYAYAHEEYAGDGRVFSGRGPDRGGTPIPRRARLRQRRTHLYRRGHAGRR